MESVSVSLVTKVIGWIYSLKDWIYSVCWIFKNATKIRNGFDKITAEHPCPICKAEMTYSKKIQATQPQARSGKMVSVPIDGRYHFYYKCPNTACAFKDEVPFFYQSW